MTLMPVYRHVSIRWTHFRVHSIVLPRIMVPVPICRHAARHRWSARTHMIARPFIIITQKQVFVNLVLTANIGMWMMNYVKAVIQ